MARIPGSHPGFPGSVPGQGMKILLHTTAHCCLAKIKTGRMISLAHGDCSGQDRTERPKSGLFHHQWGLCRGSNVAFQKWGTLVSACGRHGRSQAGYRSFCRTRMRVSGGRKGKLDFPLNVAPFLLWLVTAARTPFCPFPFLLSPP